LKSSVNLDSVINMPTYLSAEAAALKLDVSRATLYAYVSRGLIRSRAVKGERRRKYAVSDIERLVREKSGRRDPAAAARRTLFVDGLPVLSSSLTLIDGGRVYYRGQDAVLLSRTTSFERVVALLWDGPLEPSVARVSSRERAALEKLPFIAAAQVRLARAGSDDPGALDLSPQAVRRSGSRIIAELALLAARSERAGPSMAHTLSRAWSAPRARAALDAALILCADHELNVSAFTARVIASSSATPYMALSGALAALSGARHGGATADVGALLDASEPPESLVTTRLQRGEALPGFGHPLYPEGDPRAARLLELCPGGAAKKRAAAVASAVEQRSGLRPNLDFGLVVLSRSLELPPAAPLMLFALGRAAGWIAHCLEQYADGSAIRPRARYVDAPPAAAP
jgi:citrate synthase